MKARDGAAGESRATVLVHGLRDEALIQTRFRTDSERNVIITTATVVGTGTRADITTLMVA